MPSMRAGRMCLAIRRSSRRAEHSRWDRNGIGNLGRPGVSPEGPCVVARRTRAPVTGRVMWNMSHLAPRVPPGERTRRRKPALCLFCRFAPGSSAHRVSESHHARGRPPRLCRIAQTKAESAIRALQRRRRFAWSGTRTWEDGTWCARPFDSRLNAEARSGSATIGGEDGKWCARRVLTPLLMGSVLLRAA
jgi:hypothetical protein